jgi:hypothetical protein
MHLNDVVSSVELAARRRELAALVRLALAHIARESAARRPLPLDGPRPRAPAARRRGRYWGGGSAVLMRATSANRSARRQGRRSGHCPHISISTRVESRDGIV